MDSRKYLSGLGNYLSSEALPGALPLDQNSPQKNVYDLYTEQLSGSPFTMPRHENYHSWLYRILPSVLQGEFTHRSFPNIEQTVVDFEHFPPQAMRWSPMEYPTNQKDFLEGLVHFASNGEFDKSGASIYLYAINNSMNDRYFSNNDGELLIVLQEGELSFHTEFGIIDAQPTEIVVIPRGVKFSVFVQSDKARGYVLENFGQPFRLPELGLLGANALANPRHFFYPTAAFEEHQKEVQLFVKFSGKMWRSVMDHSPLNVVAWHGNYIPYKYDLTKFNTMNTVSFDHPDPSIFTVLTSPSTVHGTANIDFVIFPDRWMVAEHTFRSPYFHRNIMNEYMGLIIGTYDAKKEGFMPGGGSLHNCMTPHGPDAQAFEQSSNEKLAPQKYEDTLAFMFESSRPWRPTQFALDTPLRQKNYNDCWKGLPKGLRFL